VRAHAVVVVECDAAGRTVWRTVRSQAPLVLRRSGGCLYLVAAAGGPLGGDGLLLEIEVHDGASLTLRTVAASVAQPSSPPALSTMTVRATVGRGARLELLPEPVVISDRARHAMDTQVTLAGDASLELREEIVLGRHAETGGHVVASTSVVRDGHPLLRQSIDVDGASVQRRAVIGDARAFGSLLVVSPSPSPFAGASLPIAPVSRPGLAVMPIADGVAFATALGSESLVLRARLTEGARLVAAQSTDWLAALA
jgi:urease accessory protein